MANQKMTNREWVDFLVEQFEVSRTTARDMLHSLMVLKTYDNYKRDYKVNLDHYWGYAERREEHD